MAWGQPLYRVTRPWTICRFFSHNLHFCRLLVINLVVFLLFYWFWYSFNDPARVIHSYRPIWQALDHHFLILTKTDSCIWYHNEWLHVHANTGPQYIFTRHNTISLFLISTYAFLFSGWLVVEGHHTPWIQEQCEGIIRLVLDFVRIQYLNRALRLVNFFLFLHHTHLQIWIYLLLKQVLV